MQVNELDLQILRSNPAELLQIICPGERSVVNPQVSPGP